VAAIAVDALGADRVHPVLLPSPYTSDVSLQQARELAANLGTKLREIPIQPGMAALDAMLAESFTGKAADVTEENIQSRLRGVTLMALSNKFGWMVMTTGNKSEIAVGYATIYGDMCGGYNPIKDLYKTEVYTLARWYNARAGQAVIPEVTITRAPSAELRDNQTDQDSLPPYEELDAILRLLIEERQPIEAIVALGHDEAVVQKVARLLRGAEYKRRQAAPGVKLSRTSFGRDWRYPLVNRFIG
jgi:NAD+ synthase